MTPRMSPGDCAPSPSERNLPLMQLPKDCGWSRTPIHTLSLAELQKLLHVLPFFSGAPLFSREIYSPLRDRKGYNGADGTAVNSTPLKH